MAPQRSASKARQVIEMLFVITWNAHRNQRKAEYHERKTQHHQTEKLNFFGWPSCLLASFYGNISQSYRAQTTIQIYKRALSVETT